MILSLSILLMPEESSWQKKKWQNYFLVNSITIRKIILALQKLMEKSINFWSVKIILLKTMLRSQVKLHLLLSDPEKGWGERERKGGVFHSQLTPQTNKHLYTFILALSFAYVKSTFLQSRQNSHFPNPISIHSFRLVKVYLTIQKAFLHFFIAKVPPKYIK